MTVAFRISSFLWLPFFLLMGHIALCQDSGSAVVPPVDSTAIADSSSVGTPETTAPDTFTLRTLPDSLVRRWKRDPRLAYANDPAYWTKEPVKPEDHRWLLTLVRVLSSKAFQYTLYILLGALLVYAVYRIMNENNVQLFYRSPRKRKGPAGEEQPGEEMEEDLHQQLQHYIQKQDYRQATRYLYLISLALLNGKGLIRWHPDWTNQQYIEQLKGSSWESSFRFLTGIYEKVWYGEFPLGSHQFDRLRRYFEEFYKTIPA